MIFVFEALQVEWLVSALVDDPFQWMVTEALDEWRPLVDGKPRIAREGFAWERAAGARPPRPVLPSLKDCR